MNWPKNKGFDRHPLGLILEQPGRLSHCGYERLVETHLYGKSPETRRAYRRDLQGLVTFMGLDSPAECLRLIVSDGAAFANQVVLGFKEHLISTGKSPATINRRLASLRSLFKLARTLGLIAWNVDIANVRSVSYRDTRGPGLDAIAQMIAWLEAQSSPKAVRDLALMTIAVELALRRGEICRLDVDDLSLSDKALWVRGKGQTEKIRLSLPENSIDALQKWLTVRGPQPGPLFINFDPDPAAKGNRLTGSGVYRIIRKLGQAVGVETRPHGLRHSALSLAIQSAAQNGIPLTDVKNYSRHKSVAVLEIYYDAIKNTQGALAEMVSMKVKETKDSREKAGGTGTE